MPATSSPTYPPRQHVPPALTERKRKAGSKNSADTTRPESSGRKTPTSIAQVGTADTTTPFRPGSAQRSKESATNSRSGAHSVSTTEPTYNPTNNPPAAAPKSTQLDMDQYLMKEMRGAIFCDPAFVENFLTVEEERMPLVEEVLMQCPPNFCDILSESISGERALYRPIVKILNSIKELVDNTLESHGLDPLGTDFLDHHASSFSGVDPEVDRIKPDLVLFEGETEDWETLMMPIEVKAKHTYLKVGMKQLTRYARAVFAHQIHRRYLYGMVICGWAVTFVRFDRSGILHSRPIDMRQNPKDFQRAFVGLMMLDRDGFGYDTAFTTERAPEGRMEYYIDLPAEAIPSNDAGFETAPAVGGSYPVAGVGGSSFHQTPTAWPLPTRRFKVMERLCHRKCIRGRATIVLRLREVRKRRGEPKEASSGPMTRQRTKQLEAKMDQPWEEVPGGCDYVLKLMWRDPNKWPEGEVLKRLVGAYGVVQYLWHSDILKSGPDCHELGARSCDKCCDATPARLVEQASNLGDLDIEVPEENEEEEPQYTDVETGHYTGTLYTYRMARIYTRVLVASVGRLLWTAQNAREFLEAILDAILGYWHVVNRGILHRDISDGNVLIGGSGGGHCRYDWEPGQEAAAPEDLQATAVQGPLAKSRRLLQAKLTELSRDPRGFLSDYDLFATHSGMEFEFFGESLKRKDGESDSQASDIEDATEPGPDPKRRKQNSRSIPSNSSTGKARERDQSEESNRLPTKTPANKTYKPIDFRTGTPTFMSSRVLHIKLGERYEHHFMDDLQSFFWLIYWCVIQHVDSGSDGPSHPTEDAVKLLDQLDPADSKLDTLAVLKDGILMCCFSGGVKRNLEACKNSWADDPAIVRVIQELGTYFFHVTSITFTQPISQYTPDTEFPKVVHIISQALEEAQPNAESPLSHLT
ncbi:hypothetical protein FRC11_013643 [Ceratobasidium sp. 423]|nr:hypothetical protein FRC11_013643 [Ceratobasidium sp. 423]